MKILVISQAKNAEDRQAWSGTNYHIIESLKRVGFEVHFLNPLESGRQDFIDKLLVTYWLKIPKLFGKNTRMLESFYVTRLYKHTFKNYDFSSYDVIFVPSNISIIYSLPKTIKSKIVNLADSNVEALFEYYTEFSNLVWHNYMSAMYIGRIANKRSDLIITSSDWCRNNTIRQYNINPQKVATVEFGANMDFDDIPAINRIIDGKQHINIYWSGVNWERKGGDIALACCEELIRRGLDITFNVTGLKLNSEISKYLSTLPYVVNYGFLNKNIKHDYEKLINIIQAQDIFLFPSKAECSSIALCEANGFGLPCFVFDTGGTGNYVINGVNGYMLPLSASGKEFADRIHASINNKELDRLSLGAVELYRKHLNWNIWACKVRDLLRAL